MCSNHIIPKIYNLIMELLHFLIVSLLIVCSFFVLFSTNPVHSVLFLILCFCEVSFILFLFNVEFLSLLFLIIYVGAIAVLFLFVVMMLNVKIYAFTNISYFPFILLSSAILIIQIFINLEKIFNNTFHSNLNPFTQTLDSLNNIDVFGQALFNNYLICFLLAGLILLVAMVGAIVLTLTFKSQRKGELFSKQLSRSDNFLSFFK